MNVLSAPLGPISNPVAVIILGVNLPPMRPASFLIISAACFPLLPLHKNAVLLFISYMAKLSFVFLMKQCSKNTTKSNNPFAVQFIFCQRLIYCHSWWHDSWWQAPNECLNSVLFNRCAHPGDSPNSCHPVGRGRPVTECIVSCSIYYLVFGCLILGNYNLIYFASV